MNMKPLEPMTPMRSSAASREGLKNPNDLQPAHVLNSSVLDKRLLHKSQLHLSHCDLSLEAALHICVVFVALMPSRHEDPQILMGW